MALSRRERATWKLLAAGYSNLGIAEELVINRKGVENYINHLYQELELVQGQNYDCRVTAAMMYLTV